MRIQIDISKDGNKSIGKVTMDGDKIHGAPEFFEDEHYSDTLEQICRFILSELGRSS